MHVGIAMPSHCLAWLLAGHGADRARLNSNSRSAFSMGTLQRVSELHRLQCGSSVANRSVPWTGLLVADIGGDFCSATSEHRFSLE